MTKLLGMAAHCARSDSRACMGSREAAKYLSLSQSTLKCAFLGDFALIS
jgi:hypothetical protein